MPVRALRPAESVSFQPRKPVSCKRSTFRETPILIFGCKGFKFFIQGLIAASRLG